MGRLEKPAGSFRSGSSGHLAMARIHLIIVGLILSIFLAGCGGGGEKGKNKDKDVPKPAEAPGK
jgi:hypothetical protein